MTRFVPREVLIPVVGTSGDGVLCRVVADGQLPPPHPAHLDRAISDLLECGLYQAGQQAQAAVRRLDLSSPWSLLAAPVALSVVNPGDVMGLAVDNAASAELGLALAKLMYAAQSAAPMVIATGKLDTTRRNADAIVEPIHHLGAKLAVVQRYFRQPGAPRPPELFFVPETDPDGRSTVEKYSGAIAGLSAMGIAVVPVGGLRAAAARLDALRVAESPRMRLLRRTALLGASAAILGAVAAWIVERPIELAFMPKALDDGRILATPARMQEGRDGRDTALTPCILENGTPAMQGGDVLAAQVRSGAVVYPWAAIDRHYHIVVAVSAQTGAKVLPLPWALDKAIPAGTTFDYKLDVADGSDEDNLIVVLAQRFRAFDPAALDAELRRLLDPLLPSERINAAQNYLSGRAPGVLSYLFRSVRDPAACRQ